MIILKFNFLVYFLFKKKFSCIYFIKKIYNLYVTIIDQKFGFKNLQIVLLYIKMYQMRDHKLNINFFLLLF